MKQKHNNVSRETFKLNEHYYTDINSFLLEIDGKYKRVYQRKRHKKGYYYYNVPCAFDIETSSFYVNNEKQAIMYIWQFAFNGSVIIGRTWDDFIKLLNAISEKFNITIDNRLIIYVHNLSYEFQFMRKYLEWENVFAVDNRKPIKCCTVSGIEFRDSYILSGYSLEKTGEQLHKYKVSKLVGNLDYDIIRTPKTHLTKDEISYCINDVLVVSAYIQEQIEQYGNILKVPLTNTGRVRTYCRNRCFGKGNKDKTQYYAYKKLMKALQLNSKEYELLANAFMGGFTHANANKVNRILYDVSSYDFTSSYPAVMLLEQYPMGKGIYKNTFKSWDEYKQYNTTYCMVFDLLLEGVSLKVQADTPISSSKCRILENPVINNGRVASADKLLISCTNVDLDVYLAFYNIEHLSITNCYCYIKDYLPKPILQAILDLYKQKTELKGVENMEVEYLHSKGMINSCYGMMVTSITRPDYNYNNGEWEIDKNIDIEKAIADYNGDKNRFLFYPWGIFVTAYARRNLFSAILECGNDYCYSDTDSVKILNRENHLTYFDAYNNKIIQKIKKCCKENDLDENYFSPKTIKGVIKTIGIWDYEGTYTMFKTLGAKRYLYVDDDKLHATIAGTGKQKAVEYLISKYKTYDKIFKAFTTGLEIPENYTGKLTHTYIDDTMEGDILDIDGNLYHYKQLSGIHLEKTTFKLSLTEMFLKYIMGVQDEYRL